MKKKTTTKPSTRRAKKRVIKDLDARTNPKGGGGGVPGMPGSLNFIKIGDLNPPTLPTAIKIDFHK